jgi:hypothetical protein
MQNSKIRIVGRVVAELYGPDGRLKQREEVHNLVTDNGDAYCASKVYGGSPTAMANMKLGIATTAAAKNGAGSFTAVASDYISGSAKALDATFPKQGASANIAQYQATWAAGVATNATINSVSITDNVTDAGEAGATHTLARAVFSGAINKGAADSLVVTWNITFLGA